MTRGIWWLGGEENGEIPINAPEWGAFARVVVRWADTGEEIPDGYDNAVVLVKSLPMLQVLTQMSEDPRLQRKLKKLGYLDKIKSIFDKKLI